MSPARERPTRQATAADYELIVHTIRVTVHTRGLIFDKDTRSANHASIYLLTDDGSTSIRLNMVQGGLTNQNGSTWVTAGDEMGIFEITRCNYAQSNSSLRDFDLKVVKGLKVKHGRHEYKLHRIGVGCRYWVQTVIKDLHDSNFIKKSSPVSAAKAMDGLQYNYSAGQVPILEEIEKGTFV